MIIALFPHVLEEKSKKAVKDALSFLTQKGIKVVIEDKKAKIFDSPPLSSVDPKKIDFRITLGGDGTILHIAHAYSYIDAPILGINLGYLGFMADVQCREIIMGLEDLLKGNYTIQNRIMIKGQSEKCSPFFAINDCVFHRANNPHLVEFTIHINSLLLNTFKGDGVIVATPTGSTAYSLAAGGPILTPEIEGFILTPICPHTISNRPIVLPPTSEIKITYTSPSEDVQMIVDGLHPIKLHTGDYVLLKQSHETFKLINLTRIDYFSTLRTKLAWSGKL